MNTKNFKDVNIGQRSFIFLIYTIIFYLTFIYLSGQVKITGGGESLWFISILGLLVFRLFSAPFFSKPSDSIASGISGFIAIATYDISTATSNTYLIRIFSGFSYSLYFLLFFSGLASVILKEEDLLENKFLKSIKILSYRLSSVLGQSEIVFTPLALISIFGYYSAKNEHLALLLSLWIIICIIKPIEKAFSIALSLYQIWKGDFKINKEAIGKILRIDSPNLIRILIKSAEAWNPEGVKIARLADEKYAYILPLFYQIQNDRIVGTGLLVRFNRPPGNELMSGYAYSSSDIPDRTSIIKEMIDIDIEANLVGFVVEDSHIKSIKFEIASKTQLKEGFVVFCKEGENLVFYQITDALTSEESFKENPHGTRIVTASQLGISDNSKGFVWFPWVPDMNTPVFLYDTKQDIIKSITKKDYFSLGNIPGTRSKVSFDFSSMAKFHSAVLGVTGMGKTEVVFDIIREGIKKDTKIVCIDFTGDYRSRLNDLKPKILGFEEDTLDELNNLLEDAETGEFGAPKEKKKLYQFLKSKREDVAKETERYLKSNDKLALFELEDIANTRATLRVTELYLSSIFKWARINRSKKQILIVLEEAHTIVPEFNLFKQDKSDTDAVVGRISQIALQGRKYGVGLLLVSQRTALVSKTILSQCNTYITFQLIDKTSLDYLEQVYGSVYTNLIPNLRPLQALVHGKGVISERPVVIDIPFSESKKKASENVS